jgi:hypothetical protein
MICPFCSAESVAHLASDGADGVPGVRDPLHVNFVMIFAALLPG